MHIILNSKLDYIKRKVTIKIFERHYHIYLEISITHKKWRKQYLKKKNLINN